MTTEAHGVATPATTAPQLPTPRARLHGRPPGVGRGWPHGARAPRCGSVESGPSRPCVGTESVPPAAAPRAVRVRATDAITPRVPRWGKRQKVCATPPPPFGAEPGSDRWGPRWGKRQNVRRGHKKKGSAVAPPSNRPVPWLASSQRPVLVPWTTSTGRILCSRGWDVGTPMGADRRRSSRGPDATRRTRRQHRQIRHTRRGTTADKRVHQNPAHASGRTLIGRHQTRPSGPVRFASDRTIPRRMGVPRCPWWCMEASRRPESKTVRPSGRQGGTA